MERVDEKIKTLVRENEKEISYEHWVELVRWMLEELDMYVNDVL